ncbi:hypothetical protein PRIPAC_87010 [Pristionchus pacificus]|uniref:Uncharacterized protein n=1 Tax=Pristionchus pacificus TaxID=54126 RepID=A0A2A6BTJ4_PRIPA|nr:hypothetical protein PRIPAC_87010 [Pristionchus pacificus]|eukprot:PDM69123.1 hypothetical protein PRIPAC_47425 [Pristionchus pacificus]
MIQAASFANTACLLGKRAPNNLSFSHFTRFLYIFPHMPNSCCDLLSNQRNFKHSPSIDSSDLLSNLPVDCINPVIEFLNQDDLDELMVVSQWMGRLAIENRSKIKRKPAESLQILTTPQNISVCLLVHEKMNRVHILSKIIKKRWVVPKCFKGSVRGELPCSVYDRIRYMSDRFEPSQLYISNVLIGETFLIHCEQAFSNYTFLKIENIEFIDNVQTSS